VTTCAASSVPDVASITRARRPLQPAVDRRGQPGNRHLRADDRKSEPYRFERWLVTTNGPLAKGSYVATGTISDANGHTGTFSYTLDVGSIVQSSVATALSTSAGSATFTSQLGVTGGVGTVTFAQTTGSPAWWFRLRASSRPAQRCPRARTHQSTMSDASGDSGTFRFSLGVGTITRAHPPAATVTADASSTYTSQLGVTGSVGTLSTSRRPQPQTSSSRASVCCRRPRVARRLLRGAWHDWRHERRCGHVLLRPHVPPPRYPRHAGRADRATRPSATPSPVAPLHSHHCSGFYGRPPSRATLAPT